MDAEQHLRQLIARAVAEHPEWPGLPIWQLDDGLAEALDELDCFVIGIVGSEAFICEVK